MILTYIYIHKLLIWYKLMIFIFFVISVTFAEFHLDFMYRTSPSPKAKVPGASQSNAHQGVFFFFFPVQEWQVSSCVQMGILWRFHVNQVRTTWSSYRPWCIWLLYFLSVLLFQQELSPALKTFARRSSSSVLARQSSGQLVVSPVSVIYSPLWKNNGITATKINTWNHRTNQ